jgi:hypothetical protein
VEGAEEMENLLALLLAQGTTLGYNGLNPYALKGQKLLAQGTTLGYNGLKPYALKGQKLSLNTNF